MTDATYSHDCLAYPGGGAGWAMSAAALKILVPQLHHFEQIARKYRTMAKEGEADDLVRYRCQTLLYVVTDQS